MPMVLLRMPRMGVVFLRKSWKCWIMGLFVNLGQFFIRNLTHFSRTFWSKTSLTVVYVQTLENLLLIWNKSCQVWLSIASGWILLKCQSYYKSNGESKYTMKQLLIVMYSQSSIFGRKVGKLSVSCVTVAAASSFPRNFSNTRCSRNLCSSHLHNKETHSIIAWHYCKISFINSLWHLWELHGETSQNKVIKATKLEQK